MEFRGPLGNYALGIAAARGNTAVIEYLLHEININKGIRNNEGKTPLDIAQETDHQEVVRYVDSFLGGATRNQINSIFKRGGAETILSEHRYEVSLRTFSPPLPDAAIDSFKKNFTLLIFSCFRAIVNPKIAATYAM